MLARLVLTAAFVFAPTVYAEGNPDFVPLPVGPPAATGGSRTLTVTSWNVKHLGRGSKKSPAFDATQASPMLADADIVVFQEVNKSKSGLKALRLIAQQLKTYIPSETFCMGLSEVPSGSQERYAYLWKLGRVAYVKTDGTVMETCESSTPVTIRVARVFADDIVREPAIGSFFFRPLARPFVLAGVHLVPKDKHPAQEVDPLFATFAGLTNQPVIVAGDFNLSAADGSFVAARNESFSPSLSGQLTSLSNQVRKLANAYDNFWTRDLTSAKPPRVINLYEAFPEKTPTEIYETFSDHCPITAWFDFPEKN